jgi:hypothetical protein
VNAFDWQAAYQKVFDAGGFGAVICALPSHRPFSMKSRDEYFQMRYTLYAKNSGMYSYFIERGLSLLRQDGVLSCILPDDFLRSQHARPLRKFLLSHQIEEIADTGECNGHHAAGMQPCLLRITKE